MRNYRESCIDYIADSRKISLSWLYLETIYADDIDIVAHCKEAADYYEKMFTEALPQFNLQVNAGKCERSHLTRNGQGTENVKKLGSRINGIDDVRARVDLSNAAFKKMCQIWLDSRNIRLATKVRLYNACIKPILLYNAGALDITVAGMELLETTHRRHLRYLAGVKYYHRVTIDQLYERTGTEPLNNHVRKLRWNLFGHILRRNKQIPANIAMQLYFESMEKTNKVKGTRYQGTKTFPNMNLCTVSDLGILREKAADIDDWKAFVQPIFDRYQTAYMERKWAKRERRLMKKEDNRPTSGITMRLPLGNHVTEAQSPLVIRLAPAHESPLILRLPQAAHARERRGHDENNL